MSATLTGSSLRLDGIVPDQCTLGQTSVPSSVVGDIDVRGLFACDDWTLPSNVRYLGSKVGATTANYSWLMYLSAPNQIGVSISVNGTTVLSVVSTTFVPPADGALKWIRFTRVQSSGLITIYSSDDGSNWTSIGSGVQGAGSALFNSTAPLIIGGAFYGANNATGLNQGLNVYKFELRSGINGTIVASCDFTVQAANAQTFIDAQSNTWYIINSNSPVFIDLASGDDNGSGDSYAIDLTGTGTVSGLVAGTATFTWVSGNTFTPAVLGRRIMFTARGVFLIVGYISPTVLTITALSGGTSLNGATYTFNIGGRFKTFAGSGSIGPIAANIVGGDVFKIKKSPDPVNTGLTAMWTKVDTIKNDISITSALSNASPIVLTSAGAHNLTTGDIIQAITVTTNTVILANNFYKVTVTGTNTFTITDINENPVNLGGGGNLTWQWKSNRVIQLSSKVTELISDTQSAWTPATNVNYSANAANKYGKQAVQLQSVAGFVAGKLGYVATGTLNLLAYQQVSVWIRAGVAVAAGVLSIRLCSDTIGNVTVTTINIPAIPAANLWTEVVIDTGGALPSSIQSVALYSSTATLAAYAVGFVMASKAPSAIDSITLATLLGHPDSLQAGGADSDTWYAISAIVNKWAIIDSNPDVVPQSTRGWSGSNSYNNQSLWKREPLRLVAPSSTTAVIQTTKSGATIVPTGNVPPKFLVNDISTGWNETDMSTQDGQTWIDGTVSFGLGLSSGVITLQTIDKAGPRLGVFRYATAVQCGQSYYNDWKVLAAEHSTAGVNLPSANGLLNARIDYINNNQTIISAGAGFQKGVKLTTKSISNNGIGGNNPSTISGSGGKITGVNNNRFPIRNNGTGAAFALFNLQTGYYEIHNPDFLENFGPEFLGLSFNGGISQVYLYNPTFNPTYINIVVGHTSFDFGSSINVFNQNQIDGQHLIIREGCRLLTNTSIFKDGGKSWQIDFNSTTIVRSVASPLIMPIIPFLVVKAGVPVTVSLWVYCASLNLSAYLAVLAPEGGLNQLADVTGTPVTPLLNQWEKISVTIIPTTTGTIEVSLVCYPTQPILTTLYVDSLEITGAASFTDAASLDLGLLGFGSPNVLGGSGGGFAPLDTGLIGG